MSTTHETREGWLTAAAAELGRLLFEPNGFELPSKLRASCGFCGGIKAIGLCMPPDCADDKASHVFVDPRLAEPIEVLATLAHEMCHAHCNAIGLDCGHKGKFKKCIGTIGLAGKATATYAEEGSELHSILQEVAVTLGAYPHSPVRKKTKVRKVHAWKSFVSEGHEDEYIVRANKNVVKEFGPPKDPWGEDLVFKDPADAEEEEEGDERLGLDIYAKAPSGKAITIDGETMTVSFKKEEVNADPV